ncbi:Nodal modulator 1 [Trichinella pseudospiralis]|uniref:Nodal modulator 1 n=1 Tax=Trichinella pseudospiralis TaxID=6337 RepID=A0A0V1IK65_TRIPS|nr:Nodal modulator 1 [Trichinella pseudospiralis]
MEQYKLTAIKLRWKQPSLGLDVLLELVAFYLCTMSCKFIIFNLTLLQALLQLCAASNEVVFTCGGFVRTNVSIDFKKIMVKMLTPEGNMKYQTTCAPTNGYYLIPVYVKGNYKLKLSAPEGWNFVPDHVNLNIDGLTDPCSKHEDINFLFLGFSVTGKVKVLNSPAEITDCAVSLMNSAKEVIETTQVNYGVFEFSPVLPGNYTVVVSEDGFCIKNSISFTLSDSNLALKEPVEIQGFLVMGLMEQNEIYNGGAEIVLYSELDAAASSCDVSAAKGIVLIPENYKYKYSCKILVDSTNVYRFPCVGFGNHILIPTYYHSSLTLEWLPKFVSVVVKDRPVVLQEKFKAVGFSLTGKVLWTSLGDGINGVDIYVNNKFVTRTNERGMYTLSKIMHGTLTIQAKRNDLQFEDIKFSFSAQTNSIPPIIVTKIQQCGQIFLKKLPKSGEKKAQRTFICKHVNNKTVLTTGIDHSGKFCIMLPRGQYICELEIFDFEKQAGVKVMPDQLKIVVRSQPLPDVEFRQSLYKISGRIYCLFDSAECFDSVIVKLEKVGVGELSRIVVQAKFPSFEFFDMLPGKYNVKLEAEQFCWAIGEIPNDQKVIWRRENGQRLVNIDSEDVENITFYQIGFTIKLKSNYNAKLKIVSIENAKIFTSFDVAETLSTFCVSKSGSYKLYAESCHIFNEDALIYNTGQIVTLHLEAVKHGVDFKLITPKADVDFTVNVKSNLFNDPFVMLLSSAVEQHPVKDGHEYRFRYFAETNEKIHIQPASNSFLFTPVSQTAIVLDCTEIAQPFLASTGEYFKGSVSPKLEGVVITVSQLTDPTVHFTLVTNTNGEYVVGPLRSLESLQIKAELPGYGLEHIQGKYGHFTAYKLSQLYIKVVDDNMDPLQDVLVSVTGGSQYKSNNLTNERGNFTLFGLMPGSYYVQSILKEYSFEPSSQVVHIEEAKKSEVLFVGRRVAFSCSGFVRFLAGHPVPEVKVEAVSENCDQHQEEALTDGRGFYRIRGLLMNCQYMIQCSKEPMNIYPEFINQTIGQMDLVDVDFTALPDEMVSTIIGRVECPSAVLPTLRAALYKKDSSEHPVSRIHLEGGSLFIFPNVPMDSTIYYVKLESSSSFAEFEPFDLPEVQIVANKTVATVVFNFHPKKKQIVEHSRGSYFVFPLLTLFTVIVYKIGEHSSSFFQATLTVIQFCIGDDEQQYLRSNAYVVKYLHLRCACTLLRRGKRIYKMAAASDLKFDYCLLHISKEKFCLQPCTEALTPLTDLCLCFHRISRDIKFQPFVLSNDDPIIESRRICCLFGVIHFSHSVISGPYLIVVEESVCIGKIYHQKIFKATKCTVFSFASSLLHLSESEIQDNIIYVDMLQSVLNTESFYYSTTFDLTHTLQRLHNTSPEFLTMALYERADQRFVWNYHMLQDLFNVERNESTKAFPYEMFAIPMMLGFVEIRDCVVAGNSFKLILISRRSCHRAGVRFHTRGIDNDGNAANFIETEQILEVEDRLSSFVQGLLRYFGPRNRIFDGSHVQNFCRKIILKDFVITYRGKRILTAINLLNKRGREKCIGDALEQVVREAGAHDVKLISIDFHQECKNMNFDRMNYLIDQLMPEIHRLGYFSIKKGDTAELKMQTGVFRTNCMDCLDRTNVVQSMIAKRSLECQFQFGLTMEMLVVFSMQDALDLFLGSFLRNDLLGLKYAYSRTSYISVLIPSCFVFSVCMFILSAFLMKDSSLLYTMFWLAVLFSLIVFIGLYGEQIADSPTLKQNIQENTRNIPGTWVNKQFDDAFDFSNWSFIEKQSWWKNAHRTMIQSVTKRCVKQQQIALQKRAMLTKTAPVGPRSSICNGCGHEILDQYILRVSPDLEWHAACLKCVDCRQFLDETCTCFVRDGKPYCKLDYVRLFGVRCSKCGEVFDRNDYVMRAKNNLYHISCFKCVVCTRPLLPGDEFALRHIALYCKADYELAERNSLCLSTETSNESQLEDHSADMQATLNALHHPSGQSPLSSESTSCYRNLGQDDSPVSKSGNVVLNMGLGTSGSSYSNGCGQSTPELTSTSPQVSAGSVGQQPFAQKKDKREKPKTTRVRTVLNEKQLHTLRTCYAANPRPDALMKEQLVEMTGLSPRVIRVWFQNKRCKDKKKQLIMKQIQQQHVKNQTLNGIRMQGVGPLIASSPSRHDVPMISAIEVQQYQQNAVWMKSAGRTMHDYQPAMPDDLPTTSAVGQDSQTPFQQLMHDFGDSSIPPLNYISSSAAFNATLDPDLSIISPQLVSSDLSSPSCSD